MRIPDWALYGGALVGGFLILHGRGYSYEAMLGVILLGFGANAIRLIVNRF